MHHRRNPSDSNGISAVYLAASASLNDINDGSVNSANLVCIPTGDSYDQSKFFSSSVRDEAI
jgi:hypothetical protein